MGSSLSCLKPRKEGGPIRTTPERRPVSASELQRPASSFSSSTSVTLASKRRQSVEVLRSPTPTVEPAAVESTEVAVESATRLVTPTALGEAVREVDVDEEVGEQVDERIEAMDEDPIVGSTSDIGTTGTVETAGLIDIHVRADKALETKLATGMAKLPDKAPSLEPLPEGGERFGDVVRKVGGQGGQGGKGKKAELQRSDTMLDVRSILPVRTHVTNYEQIDAQARVDPEELVKSGKYVG